MNLLFPLRTCVACGEAALPGGLCGGCLDILPKLRLPAEQNLPPCREGLSSAGGAYRYTGCVRACVRALKFGGDKRPAMRVLAPAMADIARERMFTGRVVIPVPLGKGRTAERGYNQAAVLARAVAGAMKLPLRESLLWRTRQTAQQTKLGREQRVENVKDAFAAGRGVAGKAILLIDDVLTTGSTVSACAQVLLARGALRVDVLTAAVAPGPGEDGD